MRDTLGDIAARRNRPASTTGCPRPEPRDHPSYTIVGVCDRRPARLVSGLVHELANRHPSVCDRKGRNHASARVMQVRTRVPSGGYKPFSIVRGHAPTLPPIAYQRNRQCECRGQPRLETINRQAFKRVIRKPARPRSLRKGVVAPQQIGRFADSRVQHSTAPRHRHIIGNIRDIRRGPKSQKASREASPSAASTVRVPGPDLARVRILQQSPRICTTAQRAGRGAAPCRRPWILESPW